ncbi:MAG: hypothetical protein AABW84_02540 [Nanoarchaeota archaeon]
MARFLGVKKPLGLAESLLLNYYYEHRKTSMNETPILTYNTKTALLDLDEITLPEDLALQFEAHRAEKGIYGSSMSDRAESLRNRFFESQ